MSQFQCDAFETIIRAIEAICPGPGVMPGTNIKRVLIDERMAQAYQLGNPPGEEAWPATPVRAWCLTLGAYGCQPHHIYYGWDIATPVVRAVKELLLGKAHA